MHKSNNMVMISSGNGMNQIP